MSTQSPTTNRQAPYQEAPYPQGPGQQGSYQQPTGRSRSRIWIAVIGGAVAAALVALAAVLSIGHSSPRPR